MGKYLYQEIKDYLMKIIKENKDVANYQLPSENQLALKFQTTRRSARLCTKRTSRRKLYLQNSR